MNDKIIFRTKRDASNNYYYRIVDLTKKRVYTDYNAGFTKDKCIELSSKKELYKATQFFIDCGFKETIVITRSNTY